MPAKPDKFVAITIPDERSHGRDRSAKGHGGRSAPFGSALIVRCAAEEKKNFRLRLIGKRTWNRTRMSELREPNRLVGCFSDEKQLKGDDPNAPRSSNERFERYY